MWGNKLGWALSVLVVGFTGLMLWTIKLAGSVVTPPSVKNIANIDPIKLPVDPETLVPMDDPCDAGDYYRQAIAEFHKDAWTKASAYEEFNKHVNDRHAGVALPAVELLVKGTHCKNGTLYLHPEAYANYGFDRLELEDANILTKIAETAYLQGLVNRTGDPLEDGGKKRAARNLVEAKRLYEAAFAVGVHMVHERVLFKELQDGLGLLSEGADALKGLAEDAHDDAMVDKCSDFRDKLIDYDTAIMSTWGFIGSLSSASVGSHIGDVFYLAQHAKDRMWRVEAILTVGEYKYNWGGNLPGDQRQVPIILENLSQTVTDPVVRAAVKAANDLTVDDCRMIRGRGL